MARTAARIQAERVVKITGMLKAAA
jgi:hypothetical protein